MIFNKDKYNLDSDSFLEQCGQNQDLFSESFPTEIDDTEEIETIIYCHRDIEFTRKYLDRIFSTYSVTEEEFRNLLDSQKDSCKICGIHWNKTEKGLAIDHCHTTGKVRGLLCVTCNFGIGAFRDSKLLLNNAIAYLEDSK